MPRFNQLRIPKESNGGIPVNIQDQTSPPVDLYFLQALGIPTTLAVATNIGDTDIEVVSVANIAVGNYLKINCSTCPRYFFAEVLAVVGTTVTVDTPCDFAFDIGEEVISSTRDMNVVGSFASPSIFEVQGLGSGGLEVDITRIIFMMYCTSQPDDSLFGNISALTNGIVIRKKDGDYRNIANVKSNGDLANLTFDVSYTERSVPAGEWGVRCRMTFAGQEKHGVALRLTTDESIQIIIQDDLTVGADITLFRAVAQGHLVTD